MGDFHNVATQEKARLRPLLAKRSVQLTAILVGVCGVALMVFLDSTSAGTRRRELGVILVVENFIHSTGQKSETFQDVGATGRNWLQKNAPEVSAKNDDARDKVRQALEQYGRRLYQNYGVLKNKYEQRVSAIHSPFTTSEKSTLASQAMSFSISSGREPTVAALLEQYKVLVSPRPIYVVTRITDEKVLSRLAKITESRNTPEAAPESDKEPVPKGPAVDAGLAVPENGGSIWYPFVCGLEVALAHPEVPQPWYLTGYCLLPDVENPSSGKGFLVIRFMNQRPDYIPLKDLSKPGPQRQPKYGELKVPVEYAVVPGVPAATLWGGELPNLDLAGGDRSTVESLVRDRGDLPVSVARNDLAARALDSVQRVTILGLSVPRRQVPVAIFVLCFLLVSGIWLTTTKARGLNVFSGVETDSAFEYLLCRWARFVVWVLLPTVSVGLTLPKSPASWAEYGAALGGAVLLVSLGLLAYWRSLSPAATDAPRVVVTYVIRSDEPVVDAGSVAAPRTSQDARDAGPVAAIGSSGDSRPPTPT